MQSTMFLARIFVYIMTWSQASGRFDVADLSQIQGGILLSSVYRYPGIARVLVMAECLLSRLFYLVPGLLTTLEERN